MTAAYPEHRAGQALAGRYRLDHPIAHGEVADVWHGTDLVLGRRVAVKLLHPRLAADSALVERFRRQAQAAARLNDPRIAGIFDTVADNGIPALIIEFVDGQTLRRRLEAGPLDIHQAIRIGAQVLEALEVAHAGGVVHGAVSPSNILLCDTDQVAGDSAPVRLTDFGVAAVLRDAPGTVGGEPGSKLVRRLAPEQLDPGVADERTDIYCLGATLYEAMTGRSPWNGAGGPTTGSGALRPTVIPPRQVRAEVPRAVESVLLKALAQEPADRYPSAASFRAALLHADPGPADATFVLPRVDQAPGFLQSERSWLVPTVLVALTVVALLGGLLAFGRTEAARSLVDRARGSSSNTTTTMTVDDGGRTLLTRLSAVPYDALGDGEENDALAVHAVDGVVDGEVWRSECYPAQFAAVGKPGVGLIVQAERVARLTGLELITTHGGWRAEVHVSNRPASEMRTAPLDAWGPSLTTIEGDAAVVSVDLSPVEARTVLVFFTSIADIPADDCFGERPGSHRIEVVETRLYAAAS